MLNPKLYIKDIIINTIQRRIRRFPAVILMYHSIGYNKHFFTVTPESFRSQMAYLKARGYRVSPLIDVVESLAHIKTIPPKTVVLTFDDGYDDNFTNAFPVLQEFGFPATIFTTTDFIGADRTVRGIPMRHLSREQIRQMHNSGLIDFESHGISHRRLTEMNISEANVEMKGSKAVLEELLGVPRKLFAYPYGAVNADIEASAKELFVAAVGVRRGYISQSSNIVDLERQSIDSLTTFLRFRLKI